jgi:hypothetical protein
MLGTFAASASTGSAMSVIQVRRGTYFMRNFIAFLLAPLLPAILPAWYMAQAPNKNGLSAYIFICGLIYLLQIVAGIPAFLLFSRRGRHQLWPYLLMGFLTTTVPVVVTFVITRDRQNSIIETVFLTGYFGILGAFTALIFWLVARPDKKPTSIKVQISD